jgi:hypothetical protein
MRYRAMVLTRDHYIRRLLAACFSPRSIWPIHLAGGLYGSGVPGAIGGYFLRLASKSTMTFMAGPRKVN